MILCNDIKLKKWQDAYMKYCVNMTSICIKINERKVIYNQLSNILIAEFGKLIDGYLDSYFLIMIVLNYRIMKNGPSLQLTVSSITFDCHNVFLVL